MSLLETVWGRLDRKGLLLYWGAQFAGAIFGVMVAHLMFDQAIFQISTRERLGMNLGVSEFVATFGLISTVALAEHKHVEFAPVSVAAYITGAYWFTSSTSFANPAVTVARVFTDTFCGIAPSGVITFVFAQVVGALAAFFLLKKVGH